MAALRVPVLPAAWKGTRQWHRAARGQPRNAGNRRRSRTRTQAVNFVLVFWERGLFCTGRKRQFGYGFLAAKLRVVGRTHGRLVFYEKKPLDSLIDESIF